MSACSCFIGFNSRSSPFSTPRWVAVARIARRSPGDHRRWLAPGVGPVSDHRCVLRHCRHYRDGFAIAAERVGFIGKIVVGTIGFVWVVATALVVPVLAAEDVGPIEAIQRSVELIKKSWGEDLIGTAGIGLAFGVVMAVVAFCGAMLFLAALSVHSTAFAVLVLVILVVTLCTIALAQATLSGLYSAALYRYAAGETRTGYIHPALLESAFRARD